MSSGNRVGNRSNQSKTGPISLGSNSASSKANRAHKNAPLVETPPEGVYGNGRLMHVTTSLVGSVVHLSLKDGKVFEGVLKTFSPNFEIVLQTATEIEPNSPNSGTTLGCLLASLNAKKTLQDTVIFELQNVVMLKVVNADLEYASRGFTDADITQANDSRDSEEKVLVPWDGGDQEVDPRLSLDVSGSSRNGGWDAEEMFNCTANKPSKASSFDGDISGHYTTSLDRSDPVEFKKKEKYAQQIAAEIEKGSKGRNEADANGDERTEEEKHSSVVRSANPIDQNWRVPRHAKKSLGRAERAGSKPEPIKTSSSRDSRDYAQPPPQVKRTSTSTTSPTQAFQAPKVVEAQKSSPQQNPSYANRVSSNPDSSVKKPYGRPDEQSSKKSYSDPRTSNQGHDDSQAKREPPKQPEPHQRQETSKPSSKEAPDKKDGGEKVAEQTPPSDPVAKKSTLNPNAKEFSFNPNAKPFQPRTPTGSTYAQSPPQLPLAQPPPPQQHPAATTPLLHQPSYPHMPQGMQPRMPSQQQMQLQFVQPPFPGGFMMPNMAINQQQFQPTNPNPSQRYRGRSANNNPQYQGNRGQDQYPQSPHNPHVAAATGHPVLASGPMAGTPIQVSYPQTQGVPTSGQVYQNTLQPVFITQGTHLGPRHQVMMPQYADQFQHFYMQMPTIQMQAMALQQQQQQQQQHNAQHSSPSTPQSQTPTASMHGGPPTPTPVHHQGGPQNQTPNPQQAVMFPQGPQHMPPHSASANNPYGMPVLLANQNLHGHGQHPGAGAHAMHQGVVSHNAGGNHGAVMPSGPIPVGNPALVAGPQGTIPQHFQASGPPQGR